MHVRPLKQGIYTSAMIDDEERSLFDTLSLDSLDDEIRILRIRLRRALAADAKQQKLLSDPKKREEALTISKMIRTMGPDGASISKERIVKDFGRDVDAMCKALFRAIELRNQILVGSANEMDEAARIEARKKAGAAMDRLFTVVAADVEK